MNWVPKIASQGGAIAFEVAAHYSEYNDILRPDLLFDPANDGSDFVNLTSTIGVNLGMIF